LGPQSIGAGESESGRQTKTQNKNRDQDDASVESREIKSKEVENKKSEALSPLKLSLPLLQERGHPFAEIFGVSG